MTSNYLVASIANSTGCKLNNMTLGVTASGAHKFPELNCDFGCFYRPRCLSKNWTVTS
jgi:hypothetical protein